METVVVAPGMLANVVELLNAEASSPRTTLTWFMVPPFHTVVAARTATLVNKSVAAAVAKISTACLRIFPPSGGIALHRALKVTGASYARKEDDSSFKLRISGGWPPGCSGTRSIAIAAVEPASGVSA
jgi:hypothetical protein